MHTQLIVPPHPGLFSALGLVSSEQTYSDSRSAYRTLAPEVAPEIDEVFREMEANLRERLKDSHPDPIFIRAFDGRLLGQSWETPFIPIPPGKISPETVLEMIENFHSGYELRAGNRFPGIPVQSVTYRVETVMPTAKVDYPRLERRSEGAPAPDRVITLHYLAPEPIQAGEYRRTDLRFGDEILGPAVIREESATTFILSGQILSVGEFGELYIRRADNLW